MGDGGAQKVISILIDYLSKNYKNKFNIFLILLENNNKYDFNKNIDIEILSKINKNNFKKFIELPLLGYRLKKYIIQNNIEIVYSFLYRANYVNSIAKLFGSKHKALLGIRSRTSRYLNEGIKGKINLFLIKNLYKYSDIIISNSSGVKKDFIQLFNFPNKHVIIYNPFNNPVYNGHSNNILNSNKRNILAIGRMIPLKRFDDLLQAFSNSKLKNNYKLIFLGDGYLKEKLEKKSLSFDCNENIKFLGVVENPDEYLLQSEIFVSCSEIEGFPNVLVEAMFCKNIIISSNCDYGPSEILKDGEIGFLYNTGDVNGLTKILNEVSYLSEDQKKIVKEKLFNRAQDFKIEKTIKPLLDIFHE